MGGSGAVITATGNVGGAWKRLSAPGHHHKSTATIAFQISNRNRCLDGNVKSCRLSEDLNCG